MQRSVAEEPALQRSVRGEPVCRKVDEKSLQRSVVQPLPPSLLFLSMRRIGSMPGREKEREGGRELL